MIFARRLALVVFVFLAWTPAAFAWSWPVRGPVLQPFAYDESHPYAGGQHRGIDIGADSAGEPVVAPAAGTVAFAGTVPTSGKCVTIETPDGYSVTLTHLGSIEVAKGTAVAEGDVVGTIGPSGTPEEDAPYVHLGIRRTADSLGYVDPAGLLPAAASPAPVPAPDPAPAENPVPVPSSSSAAAPSDPTVAADPTPASPTPAPAQTDPADTTGDSQPAGTGAPAPPRPAPTASHDVADLPGSVKGVKGGDAGHGNDSGSDGADSSTDPLAEGGGTVPAASGGAHSVRGHAIHVPEVSPPHAGDVWTTTEWRPRGAAGASSPARQQRPAAMSLLSVLLAVGPGLGALLLALGVAWQRTRRSAVETVRAGTVVVHLPRGRSEQPHERRAA